MKHNSAADLDLGLKVLVRRTVGLDGENVAAAKKLLAMSDAQLGQLLKASIHRALVRLDVQTDEEPSLDVFPAPVRQLLTSERDAFRQQLVREGEVVASAEFCRRLSVTRQALSKAVLAHRIFSVTIGATPFYPSFYFSDALDRRQLEQTTKVLGDLPGWSKWQFFTLPKGSLGGITPLQALERGQFQQVKASAAGFAER